LQIHELLTNTEDPGEIVSALYTQKKSQNKGFSLQLLCNRSGISSKGLLSDVIKKRRKLPLKNADALAKAFGLNFKERKVFVLLTEIQRSKEPSEQNALRKKLRTARKNLEVKNRTLFEGDYDPLTFCLVFCCLGVKTCEPTLFGIAQHLRLQKGQVQKALKALIKMNYITQTEKTFSISSVGEIRFTDGDYKRFHKTLILQSIEYASSKVEKGFDLKESTFFDSSVISVSKKHYKQQLPKIKALFDEVQSELEVESGDELIHFNIQIHPYKL